MVSSGNLALLYLTRFPDRLDRARDRPRLPAADRRAGRASGHRAGGGADDDGPVAIGAAGTPPAASTASVEGVDPLLPYGPHARADLLRHQEAAHVGDLVLISAVDPVTEEVAAFEELVGSHGGLGGWQTEAMLVHPADWPMTQGDLDGPDAVHRQLVEWLAMLGLRTQSPRRRRDRARARTGRRDFPGRRDG